MPFRRMNINLGNKHIDFPVHRVFTYRSKVPDFPFVGGRAPDKFRCVFQARQRILNNSVVVSEAHDLFDSTKHIISTEGSP